MSGKKQKVDDETFEDALRQETADAKQLKAILKEQGKDRVMEILPLLQSQYQHLRTAAAVWIDDNEEHEIRSVQDVWDFAEFERSINRP